MTDDNDKQYEDFLQAGFAAIPDARATIARELRMMARSEGAYTLLTSMPKQFKFIWGTAADIIDKFPR